MKFYRNKILTILGPTATGKTDLAISLAKKFNGEIISCDSRQVYKGLDIGTGKITNLNLKVNKNNNFWEIDGIKIWLFDVLTPKKQYTVANYIKDAGRAIEDIAARGKLPIIVGGTGLYLKALLEGLSNLIIPLNLKFRNKLVKLSKEELQKKLQNLSEKKWKKLNKSDRENPRRLIRAIELTIPKGKFYEKKIKGLKGRYDILKIGLTAPRHTLYKRADQSMELRIKSGMLEEAKNLQQKGLSFKRMKQLGLEYGVLANFLEGKIKSADDLIKIMQGKIHAFIRRQLTWFKKDKDVKWFDVEREDFVADVEKALIQWYHQDNVATKD